MEQQGGAAWAVDGVDLRDGVEWAGFSRSGAGFFRLGFFREILFEKFFDLGGNWNEKLSILR
jgi:hypothetical protein